MSAPAEDAALAGFGRWLARERELRGLPRDEVARTTKLGPAVIDALESGEEGRMPPRAYVVGYLRTYAGAVGLDPDEVVLRYEEAAGEAAAPEGAGRAPRAPGVRLAAAALVAVAAAIAAWLALR